METKFGVNFWIDLNVNIHTSKYVYIVWEWGVFILKIKKLKDKPLTIVTSTTIKKTKT